MSIDLYCERLGPGLLAEPVNAVTNLAFFLSAWWIQHRARQQMGRLDPGLWALVLLVLAIGVGSTLFHLFATGWALLADVVPILLFQLTFLWLYLRRWLAMRPGQAALLVGLFLAVTLAARSRPELLNGSLAYGPSLLVLLLLGWHARRRWKRDRLLVAGGVFVLSLLLRTIDPAICAWQPVGSHFFWHLLNAVVLALVSDEVSQGRAGGATAPLPDWR